MRIAVCLKEVPDTQAVLKVKEDATGIKEEGFEFITSPFDEIAAEAAIRLREKYGGQITFITLGLPRSREMLTNALAMAAVTCEDGDTQILDEAVFIDGSGLKAESPLAKARALAQALKTQNFDIILCGKQAVDDGFGQVGAALAEFLGIPQLSAVTKIEIVEKKVKANVRIEGGEKVLEAALPALITCEKGLVDEPRLASLAGIITAEEKGIKDFTLTSSELGTGPIKTVRLSLPPQRPKARIIEGRTGQEKTSELVRLLIEEVKAI